MAFQAAPARLPLLERLGAHGHGRALDLAGLRDSVGRELLRLLNTRNSPPPGMAPSVPDYGLPDWSSLYAANAEDRIRLARRMERAIEAFEPRLSRPQVDVAPHPAGMQLLLVRLSGQLVVDGAASPVVFDIGLGSGGASMPGIQERA